MKTLIILKGLVKRDKLDWVKNQGLELFFLDYSAIRNLYSAPELLTPNRNILNFSYSDTVYRRFIEILSLRMSKGCLIVLDVENLTSNIIETLAEVYGYKIFWVVNQIPKDYLKEPGKYNDLMFPQKSKLEYKKDVLNYNNSLARISVYDRITSYAQVEKYWDNIRAQYNTSTLGPNFRMVTHVSDIHSNYDLFKSVEDQVKSSDLSIMYGDYIDGPCAGGSRTMLDYALRDRSYNVVWLEGNHEARIRKYLGAKFFDSIGKSFISDTLRTGLVPDFLDITAQEFSDLTPEEGLDYIRRMNRKLKLFHIISIPSENTEYICTHSGFRYLDQLTPKFIGNVVYGSRNMEKVDRTFSDKVGKVESKWSLHAHCKYPEWQVSKYPKVMNIDPIDDHEIVVMTQTLKGWKVCKIRNEQLV